MKTETLNEQTLGNSAESSHNKNKTNYRPAKILVRLRYKRKNKTSWNIHRGFEEEKEAEQ